MEESKKAEDEKFIDRVDDEVDMRIGTNTISEKEIAKRKSTMLDRICFTRTHHHVSVNYLLPRITQEKA